MEPYKIIYRGGEGEIEEKKSRFLSHVHPVSSEEEALDLVARTKKQYWDARHNCFACTVGKNFELQRFSDDGEPGGTAGRPILDILLKCGIHDGLIIVTRYFGGALLGTGGLVRAYQRAAREGLAHSVVTEKRSGMLLTVTADYSEIGKLQYLIAGNGFFAADTRYGELVETDVLVPAGDCPAFLAKVMDATGGRAAVEEKKSLEYAIVDGKPVLF